MKNFYLRIILEKIIYRSYSFFYKRSLIKSSIILKYIFSNFLFLLYRHKYKFISRLTNLNKFNKAFKLTQENVIDFNQIYKTNPDLKFYSKILSVGPSADYLKEVSNIEPDLVILTKITNESIKSNLPHLYILNNSWTEKNISLIKEVINKKKDSLIFTPFGKYKTKKYPAFMEQFKSNDLGISPMGLQRLLIILPSFTNFDSLILRGYNFGFSKKPYLSWYPSLVEQNWGTIKRGLFLSYMRHCLPYNVNLTREIILYLHRQRSINLECKELLEVIKYPLFEIIDEFKVIYTKH